MKSKLGVFISGIAMAILLTACSNSTNGGLHTESLAGIKCVVISSTEGDKQFLVPYDEYKLIENALNKEAESFNRRTPMSAEEQKEIGLMLAQIVSYKEAKFIQAFRAKATDEEYNSWGLFMSNFTKAPNDLFNLIAGFNGTTQEIDQYLYQNCGRTEPFNAIRTVKRYIPSITLDMKSFLEIGINDLQSCISTAKTNDEINKQRFEEIKTYLSYFKEYYSDEQNNRLIEIISEYNAKTGNTDSSNSGE